MTFLEAIATCFRKYVDFSGRAGRPEFWWYVLFLFLVGIVAGFVDIGLGFGDAAVGPLNGLFSLATLLPSLAVGSRRLHDIGRSGRWQLIALTGVGIFLLIYWWCQPATTNGEREVAQA